MSLYFQMKSLMKNFTFFAVGVCAVTKKLTRVFMQANKYCNKTMFATFKLRIHLGFIVTA